MTDSTTNEAMIGQIVAAFATRPDVDAAAIVDLVARLRKEVSGEAPSAAGGPRVEPALPIEKAMTRDKVFCLCCGKGFKMLKRHLGAEHGLSEAEYRTMFGLAEDFPLVAPSYSKRKAEYAKEAGFGKYSRAETRRAGAKTT